jgi:hypothetical protein
MDFLSTPFFSLRRPDHSSVTAFRLQQNDLLYSLERVKQCIKLLLCLNACYEWPNCCLCFMKHCSCCNCLGGNWGIQCRRQRLKRIRLWAWITVRDYCGYVGDFIAQGRVLVCCSWRNHGYIKVAVLIPTAKPMVSPSLFVKEINF